MARQMDFFLVHVLWDKAEYLEETHADKKGQMDGLARQTFFFYMYCGQTKPEQTANSWMMEGQRKDGRLDRWKDGWLN